jgi:hypothetical protein
MRFIALCQSLGGKLGYIVIKLLLNRILWVLFFWNLLCCKNENVFNIMCVVHYYSLISQIFSIPSLNGFPAFNLLCDLT